MTSSGKFCESCGAEWRAGSRFCEKCGQPVSGDGAASPPRAAAPPSAAACTVCGKGDRVVAASGYAVANDPEVPGDDERVDADMVALFLQRPDKPQAGGVLGWAVAPFIPLVLFFVYWFAPIHKGFKFFLFGWTVAFFVTALVPELRAMELYAFVGMFHLLFYWVALFIGRDQQKVELLTKQIPEYNAMLARWEHLRYCMRCQRAWLDNASAAPVEITDVDALLKG
jgi:hypothetical protein